MSNSIQKNLNHVLELIKNAEEKSERTPASVKLVAVSKFHSVEEIIEVIQEGQNTFGENRVQEAVEKFSEIKKLGYNPDLHIIGTLQRNKVKDAVKISNCIESVDRIPLMEEIEKQCSKINKTIDILFEYHTGEDSKSGFKDKESLFEALELCNSGDFPHIKPKGFMTMAPFTSDKEKIRYAFKVLKDVASLAKQKFKNLSLTELSMGMSGDFEIAIEEGSTMVRIGTAIFGERIYN